METAPTTLSDVLRLIEEVLHEHYGVDPAPLIRAAGIPTDRAELSGARLSRDAVMRLWELAAEATNDPSIGLMVGSKVRSTSFYALGVAFLTCENLAASLELLCRYYRVIATVPMSLELVEAGDRVALEIEYLDPNFPLPPIAFDSFIASIIGLCRIATSPDFHLQELRLAYPDNNRGGDYEALFHAHVVFDADTNALVFARDDLEAPLPGRSADLLQASDRVLENYLSVLDPNQMTTEVRKLLLQLLPAGKVNQEEVARRMHMSRSTLHRRLRQENTNFKEVMDSTRRSLAIEYVMDRQHSLSYVAFVLGFADQSNFSRAFRRWTGSSPKEFRDRD